MDRQLASRNAMVDWQVAPPDYMIATYDKPKFEYRHYVEGFIHPLPKKSAKKKTFVTISTNVLCAEVASKDPNLDPIERDIYQPLEIALSRWTVSEFGKEREDRSVTTKVWIINPGPPSAPLPALDHSASHKIEYRKFSPHDTYIERDPQNIVKEINAFLTSDRTVFSNSLRHCRQDLGCLKWLNREGGYKMKPIKVFSAEDLYVVLLRHICPDDYPRDFLCHGVARFRYDSTTNNYEVEGQCRYHQDRLKEDESEECGCCAKLIAESWAHVIMDDIRILMELAELPSEDPGTDVAAFSSTDPSADLSAGLGALNIR